MRRGSCPFRRHRPLPGSERRPRPGARSASLRCCPGSTGPPDRFGGGASDRATTACALPPVTAMITSAPPTADSKSVVARSTAANPPFSPSTSTPPRTRALTGQHVISSDGKGASRALSWRASPGSSPSQAGHASRPRTTGIRSCSSAHGSFGVVVTIAKVRIHSSAAERQFSHKPASAISPRSARATA